MKRAPTIRGINRHMVYTVPEVARAMRVAVVTVRRWIKGGLPYVPGTCPRLVRGIDLIDHLHSRKPPKRRCQLHECYCFKCRDVRPVAFGEADYIPKSETFGNLVGLCAGCSTLMHKAVARRKLDTLCGILSVTIRQAP